MASSFYTKGKEKILSGSINFPSDTIKVALVRSTYSQNLATDEFYSGISSHVQGTPQTLTNKSITGGALDADDTTFAAVASGQTIKAVVLYKDTGSAATSPLLAYIDSVTGLPMATNGGDITLQWDNGTAKILSL